MTLLGVVLTTVVAMAQPTDQLETQNDEREVATASGYVFVNNTNEPVPGAIVRLVAGGKSPWGDANTLEIATDDLGKFELPIPMGHGWFATPTLPPGYWMSHEFPNKFATSTASPSVSKSYHVYRGAALNIRVLGAGDGLTHHVSVGIIQEHGDRLSNKFFAASATCDAEGRARTTIPAEGGDLVISCGCPGEFSQVKLTNPVKLTLDAVCPGQAASVEDCAEPSTCIVYDTAGRKARLEGASARITDGKLEVMLEVTRSVAPANGILKGEVVDENGAAIKNAHVALAFVGSGGRLFVSSEVVHRVQTDDAGEFQITKIPAKHHYFDMSSVGLIVKKEGFGTHEVKPFSMGGDDQEKAHSVGTIRLERTTPMKLLVVDPNGHSLAGAWLEPMGNTAVSTLFAKTDRNGRSDFDELPNGYHRIRVSHGAISDRITLAVSPQAEETVTCVSIRSREKMRQPPAVKKPIELGQTVPEWSIHEWTDGKPRDLKDFRGKVVVIEFWGIWCSPCLRSIPILKEIGDEFSGKGVEFVAIHTAGTNVAQLRAVQRLEGWSWVSGVDSGGNMAAGVTAERFGVASFPTTIIIDRKGLVFYNSSTDVTIPNKLKAAASALDLPWPIDMNVDKTLFEARKQKLSKHILSKEIDEALGR